MNKLLIFALLTLSPTLFAQTFNVSTTAELRQALVDAASNGQDDTILIADGTYKTTDDGLGGFEYVGSENNALIIQGSDALNVILDGDYSNRVLSAKIIGFDNNIIVSNVTIQNGNYLYYGSGLYSDLNILVEHCVFKDNSGYALAGTYTLSSKLTIKNSSFLGSGNAIYGTNISIYDSVIGGYVNNEWSRPLTVVNSIFTKSTGLILRTRGITNIINSIFKTSINSTSIYIQNYENNVLANNYFGSTVLNGGDSAAALIYNNVVDLSKILITHLESNNIDLSDPLNVNFDAGFMDEELDDYRLIYP